MAAADGLKNFGGADLIIDTASSGVKITAGSRSKCQPARLLKVLPLRAVVTASCLTIVQTGNTKDHSWISASELGGCNCHIDPNGNYAEGFAMRSIALLLLVLVSACLAVDMASGALVGGSKTLDGMLLLVCLVLLAFYTIWPRLRLRGKPGAVTAGELAQEDDSEANVTTPVAEESAVEREVDKEEGF